MFSESHCVILKDYIFDTIHTTYSYFVHFLCRMLIVISKFNKIVRFIFLLWTDQHTVMHTDLEYLYKTMMKVNHESPLQQSSYPVLLGHISNCISGCIAIIENSWFCLSSGEIVYKKSHGYVFGNKCYAAGSICLNTLNEFFSNWYLLDNQISGSDAI